MSKKLLLNNVVEMGGGEVDDIIDTTYNYFVFDTSLVEDTTTVTLQNYRAGDTTEWDNITYWGDGTSDTELSHTYAEDGTYTVKTKWMINNNTTTSDVNTRDMLIKCSNVNKNVTTFRYLFYKCSSLADINLSNFDIKNIRSMYYMFASCISLVNLDLSNFGDMYYYSSADLYSEKYLNGMFEGCEKLETVDLSNFDVGMIWSIQYMFYNCDNLIRVNLSRFNPGLVSIYRMFAGCSKLTYLDLSNIDLSDIEITDMFKGCTSLTIDNIIMTNCSDGTVTKITEALNA